MIRKMNVPRIYFQFDQHPFFNKTPPPSHLLIHKSGYDPTPVYFHPPDCYLAPQSTSSLFCGFKLFRFHQNLITIRSNFEQLSAKR